MRIDGYAIWRKEGALLITKVKAATQCRLKYAAAAKWNSATARGWPCANCRARFSKTALCEH